MCATHHDTGWHACAKLVLTDLLLHLSLQHHDFKTLYFEMNFKTNQTDTAGLQ
jgi:hypothetical protein